MFINEVLIGFMPDAEWGKDRYDALKLAANPTLEFYATGLEDGEKYAIQGLPLSEEATIIPLGLNAKSTGQFTFQLNHMEQFEEGDIYLYDAATHQQTNLRHTGYSVLLREGEHVNRFSLQIVPTRVTSLVEEPSTTSNLGIQIYPTNGQIYVQFQDMSSAQAEIIIYDMMGRVLVSENNQNELTRSFTIERSGVWIVQVVNQQGRLSKKVLVVK